MSFRENHMGLSCSVFSVPPSPLTQHHFACAQLSQNIRLFHILPGWAAADVQTAWTDSQPPVPSPERRRCCSWCCPSGAFCFLCVTHFCCPRLVPVRIREEVCHRGGSKRPQQSHSAFAEPSKHLWQSLVSREDQPFKSGGFLTRSNTLGWRSWNSGQYLSSSSFTWNSLAALPPNLQPSSLLSPSISPARPYL